MHQITNHTSDFFFSSITWHEMSDKVLFPNLNLIREALNQNISLGSYGTGVHEIAYVFVAIRPTNTLHSEMMRYTKPKKKFLSKKTTF